ncbi:putative RNA recognition motif (a k a RRM RBD or RNP domain) [Trypanosoma vivax]|nr:putative RNA recognition motif (a k a RRM RBD or RNP domain) [Trypanosoma vivax]
MTVQARVGMTAQVVAALNGDPCSQTSVVPANCESGVGTIYYWNTAAATMCGAQSGTMVKMNPFSVPCGAPEDLKQAQYCHGISSDNAVAMPRRPATEVIMPVPTLCTLPKESIGIVVPSLEGDGTLANPQSYPSPLSTAFCLPHPHGSPTVSLETQSPGSVVSSKPDSLLSFPVRSGVVGSDNPGAYLAMNNFKVGVIPTTQPLKPAPTVPSVMEPSAAAQLPHVPSGSLEDTSASEATSKVKSSRSQTKPKRELDSQELDDEMRSNLFVSGLHQHVTDKQLHELFAPFGEIQSAKVMLNINTGKSRGIAFVKFAKVGDAEKAMEALNNTSVFEETINVRVAKPNAIYRPSAPTNKTFVRNVPLSIKKAELIDHFSRYGQVVDVSIHNDTAQNPLGEKRNVVFITYTTTKSAELAAQATHTTTPFPQCEDIPLLAKVAEDSAHRVERLARRSGGRGGGDNGKASGTAGTIRWFRRTAPLLHCNPLWVKMSTLSSKLCRPTLPLLLQYRALLDHTE